MGLFVRTRSAALAPEALVAAAVAAVFSTRFSCARTAHASGAWLSVLGEGGVGEAGGGGLHKKSSFERQRLASATRPAGLSSARLAYATNNHRLTLQ